MTDSQHSESTDGALPTKLLSISYPAELPISEHADSIIAAIKDHQVIILAGETGSGKTTQLPKMCLAAGRGENGRIAHTQPRRLAARALSARIAEELSADGAEDGLVSYQIRFEDTSASNTRIKVMTDGILLAETRRDRELRAYDTIIIDEAHERSLNIDFLLGYLKQLLAKRSDLKLIITSATIDVDRFSAHFNDAPIIEVSGRTYPVEVVYRPPGEQELSDAIASCLDEMREHERSDSLSGGDVLIFMVGERDIRETAQSLRKQFPDEYEILPLYSRLSSSEQNRIFNYRPGGKRRIILATNVAETSITVPGIRYVIDPGLVRMSRYSFRNKIQQLPIEPVSQASANQRKGRCGRIAAGVCFRLYDEEDFETRPEFTEPELLRTNLASVILQMLDLRLGDINNFPFLQAPTNKLVSDGYKLLHELDAVDVKRRITKTGRQLAVFPTDPRFARMLIAANDNNVLPEMLVITSMLSIQDPRERPLDKRQQADEAHARFADDHSDFVSILRLWQEYESQRQTLSGNQLKQYSKKSFLAYMRMREWREIHRQLGLQCHRLGFKQTRQPPALPPVEVDGKPVGTDTTDERKFSYDRLHQSLLTGLFMQTGRLLEIKPSAKSQPKDKSRDDKSGGRVPVREQKGAYEGPRNRIFFIAPGTRLRRKQPKWMLAAEVIETSRVFARTVARVQPEWIERAADHVLKDQYLEPRWSAARGEVLASLQRSLYGLIVVPGRDVSYASVDKPLCRSMLIREGLIAAGLSALESEQPVDGSRGMRSRNNMQAKLLSLEFVVANQALLDDIARLEARLRRRDLLVSEDQLYEFYDARIPPEVCRVADLLTWYRSLNEGARSELVLTRSDVMANTVADADLSAFPDRFEWDGMQLGLRYAFRPGEADDGITLDVPLPALTQLPANRLEWLVPGLLEEKITVLLKGLPKQYRKHLVPVPEAAAQAAAQMGSRHLPLREALGAYLQQSRSLKIPVESWPAESTLPEHLKVHIEARDENGKPVARGHDVTELRRELEDRLSASDWAEQDSSFDRRTGLTDFSIGTLEESATTSRAGLTIEVYPELVDAGSSVTLDVHLERSVAIEHSRMGLARLFLLQYKGDTKRLATALPTWKTLGLLYSTIGQTRDLLDDLLMRAAIKCFGLDGAEELPRTEAVFRERLKTRQQALAADVRSLVELTAAILGRHLELQKQLKRKSTLALALYSSELKAHLARLVYPGFLLNTRMEHLQHFPRYLEAAEIRLEKMSRNIASERLFNDFHVREWTAYTELKDRFRREGRSSRLLDQALEELHWMFEEYRVSYFAQALGTSIKVSEKKIRKQFERVRESAG